MCLSRDGFGGFSGSDGFSWMWQFLLDLAVSLGLDGFSGSDHVVFPGLNSAVFRDRITWFSRLN